MTYEENARIKARALCATTGAPAIADDSGLEVNALGGRPGVHSARYGGTDHERIERLLRELRRVPRERRSARFRCVLALALPDGRDMSVEGVCEGEITQAPRGQGGFGYDPIFYSPELGRAFGEVGAAEKARVSHRGGAARRLGNLLDELFR
jgi:XTP/dITP diphosphohydrolase